MPTTRRRIEIIAFEQERVIRRPVAMPCSVCHLSSEMLTVRQAGALAQVKVASIRRWLIRGLAHGVRTVGGQYRVCSTSLFIVQEPPSDNSQNQDYLAPLERIST